MLHGIVAPVFGDSIINYVKHYIGIMVDGKIYIWTSPRSGGKTLVGLWFSEQLLGDAQKLLDADGVPYAKKKQSLMITGDKGLIEKHAKSLKDVATLIKRSWEE